MGHNLLGYDLPCLIRLLALPGEGVEYLDTLVLSRLVNYSRPAGHSLESYGEEFGLPKIKFNDWTKWSQEMEDYCVRDVDINQRIYTSFHRILHDHLWDKAIKLEQEFTWRVVNSLHDTGFAFNSSGCELLLAKVVKELAILDKEIADAFPPRLRLIREIHPRQTKYGTLNRSDFRWVQGNDLSEFNGGPFCRCSWEHFNPSSHRQIVSTLNSAGWSPVDKTQTHIDVERAITRSRYSRSGTDDDGLRIKLEGLKATGWKVNENNLLTLPSTAPKGAKLLAKRILLESRRRTLTEWLSLVQDGRIHGQFQGIGAWTHRMAHQRPNTANIPNEFDTQGKKKLLGKEMRSLWIAPKKRLLVGVDAEGIQLRIFAHYINDEEFTNALVSGRKDDKTDPHSLNQRILGPVCKSRAAAKRFIYALLLGAGLWKLAQVLECSESDVREALDRLLRRYSGWQTLRETDIPRDAKRGWFLGLDGRKVQIPGNTVSERKHLAMSGYLQNGEAVIMKTATLKWLDWVKNDEDLGPSVQLVNMVHDEWQTEMANDTKKAIKLADYQCKALVETGTELNLRSPLAGSYWNDDHKDFTFGANWYQTH